MFSSHVARRPVVRTSSPFGLVTFGFIVVTHKVPEEEEWFPRHYLKYRVFTEKMFVSSLEVESRLLNGN